jgi:DNA topoisomerase-1
VDFTARLEEELDAVAEGKEEWVEVIRRFYTGFAQSLKTAEEHMETVVIEPEVSDDPCPNCGRLLVCKMGRYGKFLACPGFPECRFAKPILKELDVPCPECGKMLVERKTKRQRKFFGCSGYPACRFTTWDEPRQEKCPVCGYLTVKKGKTALCANRECGGAQAEPERKPVNKRKKKPAGKKEQPAVKKNAGRRKSG